MKILIHLGIDMSLKLISCLPQPVKQLTNEGQCMAAGSNRNRNDIKRGFSNKPETTIKRQTTDFIRARKQLYIYKVDFDPLISL